MFSKLTVHVEGIFNHGSLRGVLGVFKGCLRDVYGMFRECLGDV